MVTIETFQGLHQLISLDCVEVKQKKLRFSPNEYEVLAPDASLLYNLQEDRNMVKQFFAGPFRSFNISLYDAQKNEVLRLRRPFTWVMNKMEVTVCGQLVSVIREENTFLKRILKINDASDQPMFRIKGPAFNLFPRDCDFKLLDINNTPIGVISKKWGGYARELFTNSDNFQIHFPVDMDVRYKAVIISTSILIDFLYYEK